MRLLVTLQARTVNTTGQTQHPLMLELLPVAGGSCVDKTSPGPEAAHLFFAFHLAEGDERSGFDQMASHLREQLEALGVCLERTEHAHYVYAIGRRLQAFYFRLDDFVQIR